jgi:predicted lactoylglutathione lyase
MPSSANNLADTVEAIRPVLPAKDFEVSKRFYTDLGFELRVLLPDELAELSLGGCSFLLQNDYMRQWTDNMALHLRVTDVGRWWDHLRALDLPARYDVKMMAPTQEEWGLVAGMTDPSGVLWRIFKA